MKDLTVQAMELRHAYGEALLELGKENEKVVVLDADVSHCTGTELFEKSFPERFFQMCVAEQNMMGAAAGFATCGYIPFANSFAVFATKRPHDQISISIAYPALNVKIVGSYTGISSSNTGATHHCLDDISTMRSIPNMVVISPGDPEEVKQAVMEIAEYYGPVYMRLTKSPAVPSFLGKDYSFKIGKAAVLKEGADVAILSTGIMSHKCLGAAYKLEEFGIKAAVVHVPTIKPLDEETILKTADKCKQLFTVEDHSIIGGLGSAISELLCEREPRKLHRIGIRDMFTESASEVEDLFRKYNLTEQDIADTVLKTIKKNHQF